MRPSQLVQKVTRLDRAQMSGISNLHDGLHTHKYGESHGNSEFNESDYVGDNAAMFTADDEKGFLALKITDDGVAVIQHLRFDDPETIPGLIEKAKNFLRDRRGVSELIISIPEELRDVEHILSTCGFEKKGETGDTRTLRARL